MSKLVKGLIPAGQPCPFFNRCELAQTNCPNDKLLKESPFSCKQARRFDALEESSQIGETSVKVKFRNVETQIDWHDIEPLIEKANLAGGNISKAEVQQLAFNMQSVRESAELKTQLKESNKNIDTLMQILISTTHILCKSEPKYLQTSWADLPQIAKKKMRKIKKLKRRLRNVNS